MQRPTRLVCLRNPPGSVPHLNDFLGGWHRAVRATGIPEVHLPDWPGRAPVTSLLTRIGLQRPLPFARTRALTPMAWASDRDVFPAGFAYRLVPWIYDCWPSTWDRWESLLRRLRVEVAFFSARGAAEEFSRRLPGVSCRWIPEAADPAMHDPSRPLLDRRIDVLELGRRAEDIHRRLAPELARAGKVHAYRKPGDPPPYASRHALADTLGQTRIMLCFPKSVTHPEEAGGLETATYRYFEAFAAGCLVMGTCPRELGDLWGYDPVLPVDPDRPADSILRALDRLPELQSLVHRNLERLAEVGTWHHRASEMVRLASGASA